MKMIIVHFKKILSALVKWNGFSFRNKLPIFSLGYFGDNKYFRINV